MFEKGRTIPTPVGRASSQIIVPESTNFVFVSDPEFSPPNFHKLSGQLRKSLRPGDALVITGGVLSLPAGETNETNMLQAWGLVKPFFEELKKSGVTVFLILGNHDGSQKIASEMLGPSIGSFYGTSKSIPKSYTLIQGKSAMICLSGRNPRDLDSAYLVEQLTRLKELEVTNITIAVHYQIGSIGRLPSGGAEIGDTLYNNRQMRAALEQFSDMRFTIMSGHQHVGFEGAYTSDDKKIHVNNSGLKP